MPSFELSKLQAVTPARALAESDRTQLSAGAQQRPQTAAQSASEPGVALDISAGLDVTSPPVDADRVAQIREALRDDSYPLVPAKIADAMIAARISPTILK